MNPASDSCSAKVYIVFLEKCRILKISTSLPPFVKLLGAVVRWNELLKQGQPFWLLKWKRTQQQPVDDAKHARVHANAERKGSDSECCVPWAAGPEPESVLEILKHVPQTRFRAAFYVMRLSKAIMRRTKFAPSRFPQLEKCELVTHNLD